MSARKLERLLEPHRAAPGGAGTGTAEEIQRQLDYPEDKAAFRRAFERDKDELRGMGIPLEVEPVPGRLPTSTATGSLARSTRCAIPA